MDNDFIGELASTLREYCQNRSNPSGESRLVKSATLIARQKLWGRIRAAALADNSTPEEEALSLLAGLFAKTDRGSLLCESLKDILDSDDTSLFLYYQAIVVRFVSQELFHRWRENDPLSSKLWRNLRRTLRHNKELIMFPPDNSAWVTLSENDSMSTTYEPISYDDVRRLAGEYVTGAKGLADIILYVLKAAGHNPDQPPVVRIEDLFAGIRDALAASESRTLENASKVDFDDPLLRLAVKKVIKTVSFNLGKIICRYKDKGRIEPEIADLFGKSLHDLLDDYSDGGLFQSYYHYLQVHRPSLSREQYRSEYRTRFEYLAELVQKDFIKAMKCEYFE